jgi:hypothetical protein
LFLADFAHVQRMHAVPDPGAAGCRSIQDCSLTCSGWVSLLPVAPPCWTATCTPYCSAWCCAIRWTSTASVCRQSALEAATSPKQTRSWCSCYLLLESLTCAILSNSSAHTYKSNSMAMNMARARVAVSSFTKHTCPLPCSSRLRNISKQY